MPALALHGPDGVREVAAGDGTRLVAAQAIAEKGHRELESGIAPADGGTEPTMPEGAGRARRTGPVPAWVGEPSQLEPETTSHRHGKRRVDLAIDLDPQHPGHRLRLQDPYPIERAAGCQRGVE